MDNIENDFSTLTKSLRKRYSNELDDTERLQEYISQGIFSSILKETFLF